MPTPIVLGHVSKILFTLEINLRIHTSIKSFAKAQKMKYQEVNEEKQIPKAIK